MKHYDFYWYGNDANKITAYVWQPAIGLELLGVLCLIHDLGEHCGRYADFAAYFVSKGYAVTAFDLQGHGKSEGTRGHVKSYQYYLDDVDRLIEETSKRFPGQAKFIYGQGLGGNIVINFALTRHPRVVGMIASAPWLRSLKEMEPKKLWLAKIMDMLWGSYAEKTNINPEFLSRDEKVVKSYLDDDLVHDKLSARLLLRCTEYGLAALETAAQLSSRMLLMHGTEDKISDHTATEEFAGKTREGVAEYKEWKGLYHELHHEPEKAEVLQFAFDWMEKRRNSSINI